MKKTLRKGRTGIVIALVIALCASITPVGVFAKAPTKEKVKYLGKGCVEVEFYGDVAYQNSKVTVKDTKGNTYNASIYSRDDDEVKFKIKNYKTGRKYNFTVKGVKKVGTRDYGSVKGSVSIPSAKKSSNISASKAVTIALKHAGVSRSNVYDLDVEKEYRNGRTYYEVEFETARYEYDYHISLKGAILKHTKYRD